MEGVGATPRRPISSSRKYYAPARGGRRGGTAVLIAAARQSDRSVNEAGADRRGDPEIDTPGAFLGFWGDWNFYSESQVYFHTIRWILRGEC